MKDIMAIESIPQPQEDRPESDSLVRDPEHAHLLANYENEALKPRVDGLLLATQVFEKIGDTQSAERCLADIRDLEKEQSKKMGERTKLLMGEVGKMLAAGRFLIDRFDADNPKAKFKKEDFGILEAELNAPRFQYTWGKDASNSERRTAIKLGEIGGDVLVLDEDGRWHFLTSGDVVETDEEYEKSRNGDGVRKAA